MNKVKVFLSSSMCGDLKEERNAVRLLFKKDINLSNFFCLYAIEEHSTPDCIEKAYVDEVQDCNILLLILGKNYRKPVMKEYLTAKENNKKIFCFIKNCNEKDMELQEFINSLIYKDLTAGNFYEVIELTEKISNDLSQDLIKSYIKLIKHSYHTDQNYITIESSSPHSVYSYFSPDYIHQMVNSDKFKDLSVDQLLSLSTEIVENSGFYIGGLLLLELANYKDSENWMIYNNRALLYNDIGLFQSAIFCYKKAIKLNSKSDTVFYNLGNLLLNQGNYIEAIDCFLKSLEIKPQKLNSLNNIAVCYIQLNQTKEAVEWATKSFKAANNELTSSNMIYALCLNNDFDKALQILSENEFTEYNFLKLNCFISFKADNPAKAMNYINELESFGGLDFNLSIIKFEIYLRLDKIQDGLKWFNEIENNFPISEYTYNNLGYKLMDNYNEYNTAISFFRKALSINNDVMVYWNNLQACYGELSDYKNAIEVCKQALEINPFDKKSIKNGMISLLKIGDLEGYFEFIMSKTFGIIDQDVDIESFKDELNKQLKQAGFNNMNEIYKLIQNFNELT